LRASLRCTHCGETKLKLFISVTADERSGASRQGPRKPHGFSLLELMVSMALLLLVTGVVFDQIIAMQRKSSTEGMKVDSGQQAREFIDQMVHDLHLAGYPKASMYSATLDNTSPQVAAGLVSISPTQIILEGDVNSEGMVYSVNVRYVPNDPNDPNCPCIRRSAMPKVAGDPLLGQPLSPYYSETEHVIPPGTGPGGSGEDLFTYFNKNGVPVDLSTGNDISTPQGQQNLASVRTVKINLSLLPAQAAAGTAENLRTSLTGTARLEP
jgi:prepilin-type N-terminal cleavage/methylation domain-containing protein